MTESNGKLDIFGYNADHQRTGTAYADGQGMRYNAGNVVAPDAFAAHIHADLDTANRLTRVWRGKGDLRSF